MIPIKLTWDTRKTSMLITWNGFFSFGWQEGKKVKKIWRFPISYLPWANRSKKTHLPRPRWVYLKEFFPFLREWKLIGVKGTFSFPDPMVNGILYGWLSTIEAEKENKKIDLTINFLGENWCSGEAAVSMKTMFYYLGKWTPLFIREMMRGGPRRGGE
jgi:hypothetical protein